jgi:hypothetical protein
MQTIIRDSAASKVHGRGMANFRPMAFITSTAIMMKIETAEIPIAHRENKSMRRTKSLIGFFITQTTNNKFVASSHKIREVIVQALLL